LAASTEVLKQKKFILTVSFFFLSSIKKWNKVEISSKKFSLKQEIYTAQIKDVFTALETHRDNIKTSI